MNYRCVNNLMLYCHGKPNATVSIVTGGITPKGERMEYTAYVLGSCVNNWQTCSFCVSASESIKSADPVDHPG